MSKSNTPLTDPTVHQIIFGNPIEEFVGSIDLPGKRTSKRKPTDKEDRPMIPSEYRDLVESRMNTIDKIAPEGPLLSEDDLNRYHRLKDKKRQVKRPVKSSSVGSAKTGLFDLDTRGASKAVSEFASKKRRADNEKSNMTIAASLGELEEKKKSSDRNTELREDLIKDIPESIEEETEREDDKKQRYYEAGVRYISQGKFDIATEFLKRSGLSTSEIDHELDRVESEPKSEESGTDQEGQDMDKEKQGAKNQNLETDSDPSVEKVEESFEKAPEQWKITPPSEEEINEAIDRGLTDRDSMFAVQQALSKSIMETDEETRDVLIDRLRELNRSMLLNDGVPESEIDRLADDYTQTLIDHNQAEHIADNENTSFKDLIMFWPKVANKFIKLAQHPIMGKKNLQSLSEFYHNTDLNNEDSWEELHDRWIENNLDFIEDMKSQSSGDAEDKRNADSEKDSSLTEPVDSAKLDTLEAAVDELEKEAGSDSDHRQTLDNIRMEIQDMRNIRKI